MRIQLVLLVSLAVITVLRDYSITQAAPTADLWARWQKHDPASKVQIDHSAWNKFLKQYFIAPYPSRINRVPYQSAVTWRSV